VRDEKARIPEFMILVTGASGFVGAPLARRLSLNEGYDVVGTIRKSASPCMSPVRSIPMADLSPDIDWRDALRGTSTIVHTAARVHVLRDAAVHPAEAYRLANTEATLSLAGQAAREGVKRFVFLSSVKVNGEVTEGNSAFTADDRVSPRDPYAQSKAEAECGLRKISEKTGMEVVIVRPPLVYGPGAKANFLSMMRWLYRGIPLPLGSIHNQRSLVAVANLVDLLVTCVRHPAAANETFLVSDGRDLSTPELLTLLGQALRKPVRLVRMPVPVLLIGARLSGKYAIAQRLCSSLRLDISKTKRLLNWVPPISVDEGLRRAADGFLNEARV